MEGQKAVAGIATLQLIVKAKVLCPPPPRVQDLKGNSAVLIWDATDHPNRYGNTTKNYFRFLALTNEFDFQTLYR